MKKSFTFLMTIIIGLAFVSCDLGDGGTIPDPVVTDVILTAPATQLGDTVTVTKTVVYDYGDDDVTTYDVTVTTIGNHNIDEVTVDGITSDDALVVDFDVDFADSVWISEVTSDGGTPADPSDDQYERLTFNSGSSVITLEISTDNKTTWIFAATINISDIGDGSITTDGLNYTYSTFTTITNDFNTEYYLQ